MTLILVFIGGGLGAISRYSLLLLYQHIFVTSTGTSLSWPWPTFAVNMIGSLAIGYALGMVGGSQSSDPAKLFLITGFLGGFTTYSAFSAELFTLLQNGAFIKAMSYVIATVILGLLLTFLGYSGAVR